MITAFIFFVHLIFMLVVFTKKWQDENLSSGFLNLGFIGIIFAVGWSISGMIAKAVMEPDGLGVQFDRDTFSLALLSVVEYIFYRMYYRDLFTEAGTEKQ